jgi:hypothetical protein
MNMENRDSGKVSRPTRLNVRNSLGMAKGIIFSIWPHPHALRYANARHQSEPRWSSGGKKVIFRLLSFGLVKLSSKVELEA